LYLLGISDFIHETYPRFGTREAAHLVQPCIELAVTLPQLAHQADALFGVEKQAAVLGHLVPRLLPELQGADNGFGVLLEKSHVRTFGRLERVERDARHDRQQRQHDRIASNDLLADGHGRASLRISVSEIAVIPCTATPVA
jgi:hypothetical protein